MKSFLIIAILFFALESNAQSDAGHHLKKAGSALIQSFVFSSAGGVLLSIAPTRPLPSQRAPFYVYGGSLTALGLVNLISVGVHLYKAGQEMEKNKGLTFTPAGITYRF